MGIRVATSDDIPRLVDLGEQLHSESPRWSRISFSRSKASKTLSNLIVDLHGVVFVAEREGVIVGGIACMATEHWASDDVVAQEVSFFMEQSARGNMMATRLICSMVAWAELRGAKWLQAGTSTGVDPERTAQLYERLGFTRCAIGLEVFYGR